MRIESCFCSSCGHYNAEAGVEVSRLRDRVAELESTQRAIVERIEQERAAKYDGGRK